LREHVLVRLVRGSSVWERLPGLTGTEELSTDDNQQQREYSLQFPRPLLISDVPIGKHYHLFRARHIHLIFMINVT